MKFRMNSHMADSYMSDTIVAIESMCRRHDDITVDYQGKDGGTVVEAPDSAIRELITGVEEDRDEYFQKMVDASSNSQVDVFEEQRDELKSIRIKLERLVENSDHKWRID